MEWMTWMQSHIGEKEWTGYAPTAFDRRVFLHTSFPLRNVMEPGCAATMSAALEESGYKSAHTAYAPAYLTYGERCVLKPGCIVGLNFEGGSKADHVTFCDKILSVQLFAGLGGNQSHQVKVSVFPRRCIVFCRWPVK